MIISWYFIIGYIILSGLWAEYRYSVGNYIGRWYQGRLNESHARAIYSEGVKKGSLTTLNLLLHNKVLDEQQIIDISKNL